MDGVKIYLRIFIAIPLTVMYLWVGPMLLIQMISSDTKWSHLNTFLTVFLILFPFVIHLFFKVINANFSLGVKLKMTNKLLYYYNCFALIVYMSFGLFLLSFSIYYMINGGSKNVYFILSDFFYHIILGLIILIDTYMIFIKNNKFTIIGLEDNLVDFKK